jgi:hypothetical protein
VLRITIKYQLAFDSRRRIKIEWRFLKQRLR